ncbi:unnamed protein product [Allacma fusca]|uniref:peptidylprolyl isomerase n=1 Tax=Allacma fusca TaxID=39272 RepID=A0A8J2PI02_9HEXA|nr:unnamed protein product [Allacma fusca]
MRQAFRATFLGLILAYILVITSAAPKLQVETTYKPKKCLEKAEKGSHLTLHYTGTFADGKVFDCSRERDIPFTFQLGVGQVIKGWDQGLLNMCVGEKRKLVVPPHLAFGEPGAGDIVPPGTTVFYETELLRVEKSAPTLNVFREIDTNSDGQLNRDEVSEYLNKQLQGMESEDIQEDEEEMRKALEEHDKLVEEIFQHEDKDKNSIISFEEFSGPKHDEL